ncbi:putative conserved integral membrane protein [Thiocapsa sp. KS1]|nr:hypothetical protein [Thiocapsa sp. KS1]CRI67038.1 putative conserved integral membrane protein [Thiocapsa sp. KS1]
MPHWLITDLVIVTIYGLLHTVLTTKPLVALYNTLFPSYTWNISYSIVSVITLVLGFHYWESSGVYLFQLTPGSLAYHASTFVLAFSLIAFFYFFKFTTSFWQWLGVKQVVLRVRGKEQPAYYRVRQEGIKRYIRFPHHTALIVLFWAHPVMTLDTLFLAVSATIYLYLGTYHQDLRGLAAIGREWQEYRANTALLIPGPRVIARMIRDIYSGDEGRDSPERKAAESGVPERSPQGATFASEESTA